MDVSSIRMMLQGAIKAFHSATARFIVHHLFLDGPGAGTGLLYDSRPFRRVPDRFFFPLQTLAGVFRLRPGVLQVRFRRCLPSVALLLRDRVTQSFRIKLTSGNQQRRGDKHQRAYGAYADQPEDHGLSPSAIPGPQPALM